MNLPKRAEDAHASLAAAFNTGNVAQTGDLAVGRSEWSITATMPLALSSDRLPQYPGDKV